MTDFNSRLGMIRTATGRIELETRTEHLVGPGTIHFAILATLGEVAAADAVARSVVPVDIHLQLLTRANPGHLVADAKVLKSGRTMAFAEAEITQEGRLVAKVGVSFATLDAPPRKGG